MSTTLLESPPSTGTLPRLWRWWTDELRALLPRRRRDPLLRKAVILLSDGSGFRVIVRRNAANAVDLGRLDQPRPSRIDVKRGVAEPRLVADEQSIALATRIKDSSLPVVLRLPASEGLVARDELPAAAERHLQEVLLHRVDVLTPWTAEQVAFDACVNGRSPDTGKIQVEAFFAPRDTVQRFTATLAMFGLRPSLIDVAGRHVDDLPRIDLLRGSGVPHSRWGAIVLLSLAIALPVLSAALFYDVWQRSFLVEERHQQELWLIARKDEAAKEQAQRLQAVADASFLDARRTERPSSLVALEIVARELPPDAWLSRFELEGNKITVTGEAREAPRVLALIGADKRFTGAALSSASTRGPSVAPELFGLPVDRFTLTALLDPNANVAPLPLPDEAEGIPIDEPPAMDTNPNDIVDQDLAPVGQGEP